MRSRRSRFAAAGALLIGLLTLGSAVIAPLPVVAQTQSPDAAAISRALDTLAKDPNLASERTMKTLRWRQTPDSGPSSMRWLRWLVELFMWLSESARTLMWVGAGLLALFLAAYIVRVARSYGERGREHDSFVAPTHVRDLDIRPEALPADIGAAARALWDRGEHRPALALLYRGMLSRLAHVHRVPIRDSSTEGDCLALAARHLEEPRRDYTTGLIGLWQRSVYGGEEVPTASVHGLCDGFGAALDARVAASGREAGR